MRDHPVNACASCRHVFCFNCIISLIFSNRISI
ncbi:MAG: hypothetical protein ACFFCY_10620 [Promethearchaeota archaeon]